LILEPPDKVQKLQAALQAKAKGSPGYRFYLLYDKVYRKDVLEYAYRCCKANRGAPGVDTARHVPDKMYQVPAVPVTLTGKKMEVPVRRILLGMPVDKAANLAARIARPRTSEAFYRMKMETAQFYFNYVFPEAQLRIDLINKRKCALPWLEAV
jgi:hypothetical protein